MVGATHAVALASLTLGHGYPRSRPGLNCWHKNKVISICILLLEHDILLFGPYTAWGGGVPALIEVQANGGFGRAA